MNVCNILLGKQSIWTVLEGGALLGTASLQLAYNRSVCGDGRSRLYNHVNVHNLITNCTLTLALSLLKALIRSRSKLQNKQLCRQCEIPEAYVIIYAFNDKSV